MLGDLGAEVIKVEPPGTGDVLRQWGHADVTGDSLWWSVAGRNKRSVTVDLRTPDGQQLVRDLVAQADILVENFRPGTLEGWGLGWDDLSAVRPELIMVRISGFGQTGPVRAPGGLRVDRRGDGRAAGADRLPGPAADPGRHQHRRLAHRHVRRARRLAALEARHRTGRGQVVDASIFESVLAVTESLVVEWCARGHRARAHRPDAARHRPEQRLPDQRRPAPHRRQPGLGVPQAGGRDGDARAGHRPALRRPPGPWPATCTRSTRSSRAGRERFAAAELLDQLHDAGVPAGLVYEPKDMLADPHFTARGSIETVQGRAARRADDAGGRAAAVARPPGTSAGPGRRSAPTPTRCSPACSGSPPTPWRRCARTA